MHKLPLGGDSGNLWGEERREPQQNGGTLTIIRSRWQLTWEMQSMFLQLVISHLRSIYEGASGLRKQLKPHQVILRTCGTAHQGRSSCTEQMKRQGQGKKCQWYRAGWEVTFILNGLRKGAQAFLSILWRTFSSHLSGPSSVSQANNPVLQCRGFLGLYWAPFILILGTGPG